MDYEEFQRKNPHLQRFIPFMENLNKESDRGAVLISGGFLEELLAQILLAFMLEDERSDKLVNGGNAPLGTFSSRIEACYTLGLISETEHAELTTIRRIRNDFAHDIEISFDNQSIIDRCANLTMKAPDYDSEAMGEVRVSPNGHFRTAAVSLILRLVNRAHYVSEHRCDQKIWKIGG